MLRTLSRITTTGIFLEDLNDSILRRSNSSFRSFLIQLLFTKILIIYGSKPEKNNIFVRAIEKRNAMNIHEYQGKEILKQFGVSVPSGYVAETVEEAVEAAKKIQEETGADTFAVKA